MRAFSQLGSYLLSSLGSSFHAFKKIVIDDKKMIMMIFHWYYDFIYIRYSASHFHLVLHSCIWCVLDYALRFASIPTTGQFPELWAYTPTHPTVLTIVHFDGTFILSLHNTQRGQRTKRWSLKGRTSSRTLYSYLYRSLRRFRNL